MTIEKTTIQDLVIITPTVFEDSRGYFFEAYNQAKFLENGIDYQFMQGNQSFSKRGVIRGLHLPLNSERLQKLTENFVVSNQKIVKAIGKPLPIESKDGLLRTFESFRK